MTNNNYKAPTSKVMDPPEPGLPPRPREVNIALWLIISTLVIQFLAIINDLQQSQFLGVEPWRMALLGAWFAFYGMLCHQIARAKRWARFLLLALTVLTFAQVCWAIGYVWRQMPELRGSLLETRFLLTRILPLTTTFIALHLLYYSSGNWFRRV